MRYDENFMNNLIILCICKFFTRSHAFIKDLLCINTDFTPIKCIVYKNKLYFKGFITADFQLDI